MDSTKFSLLPMNYSKAGLGKIQRRVRPSPGGDTWGGGGGKGKGMNSLIKRLDVTKISFAPN